MEQDQPRATSRLSDSERARIESAITHFGLELSREALTEQARDRLTSVNGVDHFITGENVETLRYAQGVLSEARYEVEFLADRFDQVLLDSVLSRAREIGSSCFLWIHGVTEEGDALELTSRGGQLERTILRMSRTLPLPSVEQAFDQSVMREFNQNTDRHAWLALNREAFVEHPEQGNICDDDLRARLAQPWFDPAGFLVSENQGVINGFSWSKVHDDPWGRIGEIYVIAVSPHNAPKGLGRALLSASLNWMSTIGLDHVMLYVDESNVRARHLYDSTGFTIQWQDQLWRLAT
jgi:mycothiol synthase